MISLKAAYELVLKNNPEMKVYKCFETPYIFVFEIHPNDYNYKSDGMYISSFICNVEKNTGKYREDYIWDVLYMFDEKTLREYTDKELRHLK